MEEFYFLKNKTQIEMQKKMPVKQETYNRKGEQKFPKSNAWFYLYN